MKTLMFKNGRRNVGDSVAVHWRKASRRLITLVLTALSIALFAPTTLASGPNSKPQEPPHGSTTKQDPQWIQAKLAFRVSSGILPGQGKGAKTHPSILSTPFFSQSAGTRFAPDAGAPASYTLGTGPYYVGEPSDGKHVNFPRATGNLPTMTSTTITLIITCSPCVAPAPLMSRQTIGRCQLISRTTLTSLTRSIQPRTRVGTVLM